jgi:hypothetical protein
MQCQSCHGSMLEVADPGRSGWLDEPLCQSCHTGTAVHNAGALRYTSAFTSPGVPRQAVDPTFATQPDTPLAGHSLYRFSTGHGGLQCEACHGATHAEYPSATRNDNLQSIALQGHVGMLAECTACHPQSPVTVAGGPHGLHPLGQRWVEAHGDAAEEGNVEPCRACHGADLRGTVLSRVKGERVLQTDFGTKRFWAGFQVGCWTCHDGPDGETANANRPPVAAAATASTGVALPTTIALSASDADGDALVLRIVDQPAHGTVGLQGTTARYIPDPGFSGADGFTFTASDGDTDGNLAAVTIAVVAPQCAGDCDGNGAVTIDELVRGVGIALGGGSVDPCPAMDRGADGAVTIDDLVAAVDAALSGC